MERAIELSKGRIGYVTPNPLVECLLVKNGEIIIQGDIREKVVNILEKKGYNYKRVGG